MSSALAQFDINDKQTGQTLGAGDANTKSTVGVAGTITAVDNERGIDHTEGGDRVEIEIAGSVLGTTGNPAFASIPIRSAVSAGVKITILADAVVNSRDADTVRAYAIFSTGDTATIETAGKITTSEKYASGILSGGGTATITQLGRSITTEGESAHGIFSVGDG